MAKMIFENTTWKVLLAAKLNSVWEASTQFNNLVPPLAVYMHT